MKTHLEHLLGYVPHLLSMRVLDLGSGQGSFLIDAANRGVTVCGVEPYQKYIDITLERAKESGASIEVRLGTAERIPFADASFDFVNICEVVEHVEDPDKLLSETGRVLARGGLAYLSVPNRFGFYDPHFHLYFINWLPRRWAHFVIGMLGKHKDYSGHSGRQDLRTMHYSSYGDMMWRIKKSGLSAEDMRVIKLRMKLSKFTYPIALPFYFIARTVYFNSFHFLLKK